MLLEVFILKEKITPLVEGVALYHWNTAQMGNTFLQAVMPQMLKGRGWSIRRKMKLSDKSQLASKEEIDILYDRAYIVSKIQATFTDPLCGLPYNELESLLSEAFERTESGIQPREAIAVPNLEREGENASI